MTNQTQPNPTHTPFPATALTGALIPPRTPDKWGVAIGDLVAGQSTDGTLRPVMGVVTRIILHRESPIYGNRYEIRMAELFPTGDSETALVYGGVTILCPADKQLKCSACGGEHVSPNRFVDCLVAHVRAAREAEVVAVPPCEYANHGA